MNIEYLREFVTDVEIQICQGFIPKCKSKDFYLGLKNGIRIALILVKLSDRRLIAAKLAAILVNLEEELRS